MADQPKLSPSQRSKIRRLSQPHEHDPSEAGGELNIVPFLDIITNVLMFVLATIPAVFTSTIETNPPSSGGAGKVRPKEENRLNLSLVVVNEGVSVKTSAFSIGDGCEPGPGVAIKKKGDQHDLPALKACVQKLKDASPDFKEETNVTIIAEPGTPYWMVIDVMDAVRETSEGQPLFPEVQFGVAK